MVNYKDLLISLILPVIVILIIPFFLVLITENRIMFMVISFQFIYFFPGIALITSGLYLLIKCILIFYEIGKGTLMPLSKIHTRQMVVEGPYKYVRNPMIIGVILTLFGEGLIFKSFSIFIFAVLFLILNMIYIPLVEEKGTIRRFGQDFLKYKGEVKAWIPSFKAYNPNESVKK